MGVTDDITGLLCIIYLYRYAVYYYFLSYQNIYYWSGDLPKHWNHKNQQKKYDHKTKHWTLDETIFSRFVWWYAFFALIAFHAVFVPA